MRSLGAGTLKGHQLMITGGPTPVWVDHVRLFTNRFTGALAIEIAKQAWVEGAAIQLILGQGSLPTPSYLPHQRVVDFSSYREKVLSGWMMGRLVPPFSAQLLQIISLSGVSRQVIQRPATHALL